MKPWTRFDTWWDKRKREERYLLLGATVCVMLLLWTQLAQGPLSAATTDANRRLAIVNSQIMEQEARQQTLQAGMGDDPNAFALNRERELQNANADADRRLNDLYGQLIDPRQMSLILTTILQRETSLQLVSVQNIPSVALMSTSVKALQSDAGSSDVQVFRHGLRMVFKGEYLETLRYLRNLEQLDNSFFWDSIEYKVQEYPTGEITLEIYTLSTQQGWIGV